MKFLSLSLAALTFLTGCPPVTKSHHKTVETERQEEKAWALSQPVIPGLVLELSEEGKALVARKQGKIWHRSLHLRPDEKAETNRILKNLKLESITVSSVAGGFTVTGKYRPPQQGRQLQNFSVTVSPDPADPARWKGEQGGNVYVMTCLPLVSGECDPRQASVIEVFTRQTLSNHKPRTIGVVYGETAVTVAMDNFLASLLQPAERGLLRSVAVLNSDVSAPSALGLRVKASSGLIMFSAVNDPQTKTGMVWSITNAPDSWLFRIFEVNGSGEFKPPDQIVLPIRTIGEGHPLDGRIQVRLERKLFSFAQP